MKILIAEDDLTSRRILEAVLAKWGYDVVSAGDGNEAWERLQGADAPRLAVLDWMMPGMNGPEICQRLRKGNATDPTYVIILTARDSKRDIIEGLESGADDYVAKPFNSEELWARIKVGQRILKLQTAMAQKEKLQGVMEMAGAVCHEMNQPLQAISGMSELLMMEMTKDDDLYGEIKKIKDQVVRMGEITKRLMGISRYETMGYLGGKRKIIDIDKSSI